MTTPQNKPEDAGTTPDGGAPIAEPVYAPASERVPKTVTDYRDVVSNPDTTTSERQAVSAAPDAEASFARVPRPTYTPPVETPQTSWDTPNSDWMSSGSNGGLPMKLGWLGLGLAGGIGVWLWMRWQRERNKPINRFRRQARQAAGQARQAAGQARQRATALRDQMPELPEFPDEARRPAVGLGTALLTLAVVLWQQSQARSREEEAARVAKEAQRNARKMGKRAVDTLSDVDWTERLQQLRDLWNPTRVELEKVSIPRR